MTARVSMNLPLIMEFLTSEGTKGAVEAQAQEISRRVTSAGSESRVDVNTGPKRVRAAVIAGYEDGATAENTRRALLGAI